MGAALPLLIVTILAVVILTIWIRNARPEQRARRAVGWLALGVLGGGWVLLLSFGGFHPLGEAGLVAAFLAGFSSFVLPLLWPRSPQ
jgi:hypothetical protein